MVTAMSDQWSRFHQFLFLINKGLFDLRMGSQSFAELKIRPFLSAFICPVVVVKIGIGTRCTLCQRPIFALATDKAVLFGESKFGNLTALAS